MRTVLGLIVVLTIASFPLVASAANIEAEAREIEELLMAPCCGGTTLALHNSSAAARMKVDIREKLAAGMNRQEILDDYVAEYGETIRSMPDASGFGLVAYLVPLLALIVGPLVAWGIVRRWTRNTPAEAAPTPAPTPTAAADQKYADRLERELRSY